MHRREFLQVTALLTGAMVLPLPARAAAGEPILYRIQQGGGTVHILGFAEATDTSWFVPKIAAALDSADALWLETPPGSATAAAEGSGAAPPPDPRLERLFAAYFTPSPDGERTELMVCHGNVIRYLVTRALGVDPTAWLGMSVGHASITRIRIEADGSFKVLSVGDVGHLPPARQSGATGDPERDGS